MNTFRLWARRLFALALLVFFLSVAWGIRYFHVCLDMATAGIVAFFLTMLVGYVTWRIKNFMIMAWKAVFAPQEAVTGRQED